MGSRVSLLTQICIGKSTMTIVLTCERRNVALLLPVNTIDTLLGSLQIAANQCSQQHLS